MSQVATGVNSGRASFQELLYPGSWRRCSQWPGSAVTVESVNGRIEFLAAFEDACQSRGRRLFVLPQRSPMLRVRSRVKCHCQCKTLTIPLFTTADNVIMGCRLHVSSAPRTIRCCWYAPRDGRIRPCRG